jgi:cysteinyl-tRNA synthetase
MNYRDDRFQLSAAKLRLMREQVRGISRAARGTSLPDSETGGRLEALFRAAMDNDLRVDHAIGHIHGFLAEKAAAGLNRQEAAALLASLRRIDSVLQVLF